MHSVLRCREFDIIMLITHCFNKFCVEVNLLMKVDITFKNLHRTVDSSTFNCTFVRNLRLTVDSLQTKLIVQLENDCLPKSKDNMMFKTQLKP